MAKAALTSIVGGQTDPPLQMQFFGTGCLVREMRAPLLFFASLFFIMLRSTIHAEKPFEFARTPGKLPKEVVPTEYSIRIVPDIDKLMFTGTETVKLSVHSSVHQLVLNALELAITRASVDGKALPQSAIKIDEKAELLTLELPSELSAGDHTLALTFSGKINQQGQGLFYMRYQEQGTGAKKIALGTQFEATDARRLFPCWDEPSFRARFQLTAVVPENWLAVSNMPIESEEKIAEGKEIRFAATPSMSSYLNVFVAGELDLIESRSGPTQIRVITTKGKAELGRYALEATAQILKYYNDYFGAPYPLPKLDQIALPGGFGGAMENWGGITYYESALLFDPKNSSAETKQDIYEVLAHEVAHQWFGDLVTMAWWDNLWLNEGFASWMGTKCTAGASVSPKSKRWKATQDRQRIRFSSQSRPKPKPTVPLTISLTKRASHFFGCWKVFSAKMFFARAFVDISPRINIRTPPPRIFGMHFQNRRVNRSLK